MDHSFQRIKKAQTGNETQKHEEAAGQSAKKVER
jgi:hypothetical protein